MNKRLKKIGDSFKKKEKSIALSVLIVSIFLFMTAFHNLDLMSNYGLIMNDINQEFAECNPQKYIDLRDIKDCNNFICDDYQTIYMKSVVMQFIAYIMLMGLVIHTVFTRKKT